MSEFMRILVSMSLSGAIVTLVLLVMKPLTRKHLSQRWQYYVWLLVVLRLLLPLAPTVTVPSGTLPSVLTRSAPSVATSVPTTTTPVDTAPGTALPTGKPATSTETSPQTLPAPTGVGTTWPVSTLLLLIWAIGALAVMIWNIAGYTRFKRTVQRTMVRVTDAHFLAILEDCRQEIHVRATPRLYTSASVASPILLGILHPAIVLPDRQLTDNDLRYALLHELTHARRQDGLLKWIAAIAVSIHWFNPLAYVMQYELNHSCELSCDETVTRQFSTDDRRGYGSMLLAVASMTGAPSPAMFSAMVEDKRNLKERLGAIMSSKKQTKRTTVVSVMSIVLIAAIGILAGCTPKATTSSQRDQLLGRVMSTDSNSVQIVRREIRWFSANVWNLTSSTGYLTPLTRSQLAGSIAGRFEALADLGIVVMPLNEKDPMFDTVDSEEIQAARLMTDVCLTCAETPHGPVASIKDIAGRVAKEGTLTAQDSAYLNSLGINLELASSLIGQYIIERDPTVRTGIASRVAELCTQLKGQ